MAQQVCYWPNKSSVNSSITPGFWPCHDAPSPCCSEGDACLSNGLCYDPKSDQAYRGTCTNPDWIGCPDQYCNDVNNDALSYVWKCPLDGLFKQFFWCGNEERPNTKKCQTDAEFGSVVSWASGTAVTIISPPTASDSTTTSVIASSFTKSTPTASDSTTTSVIASSFTKSTPSKSTDDSLARTESSPTIVTTRATSVIYRNQTVAGNKNSTTSMAIGAGFGVPLGIVAFGLIGYLLLRNRSRKNDAPAHLKQPPTNSGMEIQRGPPVPHELIGYVNQSELPASPPVYEI